MLKLLRRWLPTLKLVGVGDSAYAALDFSSQMQALKMTFVTRLRMDAALDNLPQRTGTTAQKRVAFTDTGTGLRECRYGLDNGLVALV